MNYSWISILKCRWRRVLLHLLLLLRRWSIFVWLLSLKPCLLAISLVYLLRRLPLIKEIRVIHRNLLLLLLILIINLALIYLMKWWSRWGIGNRKVKVTITMSSRIVRIMGIVFMNHLLSLDWHLIYFGCHSSRIEILLWVDLCRTSHLWEILLSMWGVNWTRHHLLVLNLFLICSILKWLPYWWASSTSVLVFSMLILIIVKINLILRLYLR